MIRRGTTPLIHLITDVDTWKDCVDIWLTFQDSRNEDDDLTLPMERLTISEDGREIWATLTQVETLSFDTSVKIQLKGRTADGYVIATDVVRSKVLPILDENIMD